MICKFCGYEFPDECGHYGCPNCLGEGLEDEDSEMNKTQIERDNRHKAKKIASGLRRVEVWVPVERVDEIKAIAKAWRD